MVKRRQNRDKDFEDSPRREKIIRGQKYKPKDLAEHFDKEESLWEDLYSKHPGSFPGRVVEVHKRYVFVSPEKELYHIKTNDVWLGSIARTHLQTERQERNVLSVGDRVFCAPADQVVSQDLPQCSILWRSPRQRVLSRIDPMVQNRQHILAANMDQLVIIASYLAPKVKWGLIDRYLVLAESQGLPAVILLNKKDLLKEEGSPELIALCQEYENIYKGLGYECYSFSALKPKKQNREYLKALFEGKISLLSGHSGVGKSSVINLLKPEIVQDVEDESILSKGRHTTSYASLIKLKGLNCSYAIDTPGIRSFLLEEPTAIDLTDAFVEFRPFLGQCHYRECRHIQEPDCAILKAVEHGHISSLRYKSYVGILTGATGREGRIRD